MKTWQIMSAKTWTTFGVVNAVDPLAALEQAVKQGLLAEGTWNSYEVKDEFRIYIT